MIDGPVLVVRRGIDRRVRRRRPEYLGDDVREVREVPGVVPMGLSKTTGSAINETNSNEVYSFHTGGANTVFADGSVRFLRESITPAVMAALVTAVGGEVVGDF